MCEIRIFFPWAKTKRRCFLGKHRLNMKSKTNFYLFTWNLVTPFLMKSTI